VSWWIATVDSISMIFTALCKVQQEIQKTDETNVQFGQPKVLVLNFQNIQ
jgi:hypothetical protein